MAFGGGGSISPTLIQALQQRQQQTQAPVSTGPTRSALVAQLLQQQQQRRPQQIQSVGEGFARLGSDLVSALSGKRAIDEQLAQQQAQAQQAQTQQQALAQALTGAGVDPATAQVLQASPQIGGQLLGAQQRQAEREALQKERAFKEQQDAEVKALEQSAKAEQATQKANKERFESVGSLRKEVSGITKDFRQQKAAIQRIRDVSFDKEGNLVQTPGSGLALVFNFMKVLDPGSVVRESEFKTAEQARGAFTRLEDGGITIPSVAKQALQSIEGKGRLLPEQIKDFNQQAEAIFLGARETALDDVSPHISAANAQGFELDRIFSKSILDDLLSPIEPKEQANDISALSDEELLRRLQQ